jgi:hypothetical protein
MNRVILIEPARGLGFQPIFSGNSRLEFAGYYWVSLLSGNAAPY